MKMDLPYGNTAVSLDTAGMQVLCPRIGELKGGGDGAAIVRAAMATPFGGQRLSELARGKARCTVILSDHTRPVPSRDILPPMLEELREGNPAIEITLLVATGCHRAATHAELIAKLGEAVAESEHIVMHDAADEEMHIRIGVLPSGAPLVIDRRAADTDLLIAEGFIEPHFFAGFSGGRKSVLPGVCARETVYANHCSRFIDSAAARTGVLDGNPIHADMLAAQRLAKLAYIVNVVIDEDKRTVAAFAGDPAAAHSAGCAFLRPYCEVHAKKADIVMTTNGGAPLDQNVYQCVKGLTAAEAAAKPDGVLILAAECADGMGGDGFSRMLRDCGSAADLYASIMATPQEKTAADQWQCQILARILMRHPVIFVTREALADEIWAMKMTFAPTLPDALHMARTLRGDHASVCVIPNGVSVIVKA